jgi:hypothetical protein
MGETAYQIIGDIERARDWLGADLDRLEDKVRYEAGWRVQYARHRLAFLGAAAGAVLLLGIVAVWTGKRVLKARPRSKL